MIGIPVSLYVSRSSETARAKSVLDHLSHVCETAHSLRYEANVTVEIKGLPGGSIKDDRYTVTGTFQQDVYARIDEVKDGKTVFSLVSNPNHLYLYNPVADVYRDYGLIPVYFAIWDMMMAQGAGSDKVAPTTRRLGYYYDITGFSGHSYAGDSPWSADHGRDGIGNLSVKRASLNGRKVDVLTCVVRGSDDVSAWKIFLDTKSGLPLRASMTAVGPALEDSAAKRERIEFREDYVSFKPSRTVIPSSVFEFTPPSSAKREP